MRHMNIRPGGTVAIQGLGGLGHLAIQYAVKSGYRTIALSSSDKKEKFARDLGAHEYIDYSKGDVGEQLQKLGGADLIVTTAPNADVIPPLIGGLGILGKLLVLSVPGEIKLNTMSLLQYGSSIQSWPSGHARDSKDAVEFTALTGVDCMVETFPLDKAQDAYDAMKNGSVRFRSVITME
jgi:D-arabinose 1-dehydrogenase-like Zn-dependent alcohol dehydrogenase